MANEYAGSPRTASTQWLRRTVISVILLAVDALLFVVTLSHVGGPWRFTLGLTFALTTPGWSLVGLLNLRDGALETGLSVAVSLALLMVCAQAMMALRIWHPVALEELACLICAPSLIVQSRGLRRIAGRTR